MTIQMWITPISSSSRSVAVIAETIEVHVDTKHFKSILPLKLNYSSVTRACINEASLHSYLVYYSC